MKRNREPQRQPGPRRRLREVVSGLELVFLGLAVLTALGGGMIYRYFEWEVLMPSPLGWLLVLAGLWVLRVLLLAESRAVLRRRLRVVAAVVLVVALAHLGDALYLRLRDGEPQVDWQGPLPRRSFEPAGRELRYPGANLIVVSIDTLRADHLGSYGYREDTSPYLDGFAREAVRFARAYAQVAVTLPSHATLFTSLYPGTHKAEVYRSLPLSQDYTTLAEVLRDAGYRTAAVVDDAQLDRIWQLDQGFETYQVAPVEGFRTILPAALKDLERLRDEKFFLFIHTYDVHTPYRPAPQGMPRFFANYQGRLRLPITDSLAKALAGQYVRADLNDIRYVEAAYDAGIRRTDVQVGRLLGRIRELGLDENTIVLVTSDHGEGFNEQGRVAAHGYGLSDELLRVPLLVRLPDGALAGAAFDYNVGLVDLMPSLLYALMIPYQGPLQGRNLLPFLEGRKPPADLPILAENQRFDDLYHDQRTYQLGRYKFVQEYRTWRQRLSAWVGRSRVFYTLGGRGLYDTYHDYDESRNLLTIGYRARQALPVAQWLEERMYQLVRQGRRLRLPPAQPVELTPEERERLRAMGYIQAIEQEEKR